VEPAERMLQVARSRAERESLRNVEFRQGSLEHLPLTNEEVDLAIASLVLHHVGSPVDALRELRRCIRGDGRLLVIEQEPYQNEAFQDRMGDHWPGLSCERLGQWLHDAGFVSVKTGALRSARRTARLEGQVPGLYCVVAELQRAPGTEGTTG
jgi:ArsR family transcriptional regulator